MVFRKRGTKVVVDTTEPAESDILDLELSDWDLVEISECLSCDPYNDDDATIGSIRIRSFLRRDSQGGWKEDLRENRYDVGFLTCVDSAEGLVVQLIVVLTPADELKPILLSLLESAGEQWAPGMMKLLEEVKERRQP
jgi:hypothetical protein